VVFDGEHVGSRVGGDVEPELEDESEVPEEDDPEVDDDDVADDEGNTFRL